MKLTCSPFDRIEMQRLCRQAKDARKLLAIRYGDAKFSSGIIDVHPARDALASYEVSVPERAYLIAWAAVRRRRERVAF